MDDPGGQGASGPSKAPRLSTGDPLARAATLLSPSLPLLPVVDGSGVMAGTVSRRELDAFLRDSSLCVDLPEEEALRLALVDEAMDRRPVTARPEDGREEAEALMEMYALPAVAVTDRNGIFLSVLTRRPDPSRPSTVPSGGSPRRP